MSTSHNDRDDLLAGAEFAYNNAWQESIKATPVELNFGQQVRTLVGLDNASVLVAGTFVGRIREGISRFKTLLHDTQQRMKVFADQNMREVEYSVGDKLLLSTKYLNLKNPGARKLLPQWVGPFTVLERIGPMAYRLELSATMKVHPVVYVLLLHPYRQDGRVQPPPPPIDMDGDLEYEVERILDHRDCKIENRVKTRYLVFWVGYGPEHNSFKPKTNLNNCQELIKDY
jgi:hypothetical protein